ncbi:MAG: WD40 repeat domain-containing protein, partial [Gammaproteobacteria bacterium]
ALTPDGTRAVSGSYDHTLTVWDLESGRELRTLKGHAGGVIAIALTPDGTRAVSGSYDHTLKVWDLESGRELRTLEGHADSVSALTPDGKRAVSASADRTIVIWELETGTLVATFGADSEVRACAAARDGVTFVAGDAQGCLHFLRLENASQPGA